METIRWDMLKQQCPTRQVLTRIADKWTMLVITLLAEDEKLRFSELRRQEEQNGFCERSANASRFFRKGEIGSWREALTDSQVQRVISVHGAVMRRLGYLDASDNPLC